MDYIEIKGYKSIKHAKVELGKINILIGSNGSGKSNFISFFDFLNQVYNRHLNQYIALRGEEKILHKGSAVTSEIYFKTEFENGKNGYSATIEKADQGFIFRNEYLIYQGNTGNDIAFNSSEARIKVSDNFRAKYVITHLNGFRKYHFHDTGKNSPFNKESNINNDKYFLYEQAGNLAAFLFDVLTNHKFAYNRIIGIIQSIAPFFSDFYFHPNSEGLLKLQWQDKYSSTIYGAADLSDGTIRFIALATLFLQPNLPSSIIIDEPELGLHPFAISKLAGLIQSAAAKGAQIILATQSADLMNHFLVEDIITVDQREGESRFNRLKSEDLSKWLDEYSVGDLWQQNIVQSGQPG